METVKFVVNGTLMRGLELEKNLLNVKAVFIREIKTAKCYRLWSIGDRHPAMLRVDAADELAVQVETELWEIPCAGLASVLQKEPEGLSVGKVLLENGEMGLGGIGEPWLVKTGTEISRFGGWRRYIRERAKTKSAAGKEEV